MGAFDVVTKFFTGAFSYTDKKGRAWFLHKAKSRGGNEIYYFSQKQVDTIELPAGYVVVESTKTGIPLLKKQAT